MHPVWRHGPAPFLCGREGGQNFPARGSRIGFGPAGGCLLPGGIDFLPGRAQQILFLAPGLGPGLALFIFLKTGRSYGA